MKEKSKPEKKKTASRKNIVHKFPFKDKASVKTLLYGDKDAIKENNQVKSRMIQAFHEHKKRSQRVQFEYLQKDIVQTNQDKINRPRKLDTDYSPTSKTKSLNELIQMWFSDPLFKPMLSVDESASFDLDLLYDQTVNLLN